MANPWRFFGINGDQTPTLAAYSHTFTVSDKPIILATEGLSGLDCVMVEQVFGCGPGDTFIPLNMGCNTFKTISECNNTIVIYPSGRYRLKYSSNGGVDLVTPSDITVYGRIHNTTLSVGDDQMGCNCPTAPTAPIVWDPVAGSAAICNSTAAKAILNNCLTPTIPPIVTDATLTGAGTAASPLHAVIPAIVTDATLTGLGTVASPLHAVIPAASALVTDATLTGLGTAASPLHAVSTAFVGVTVTGPITGNGTSGTPLALDLNALLNALAALPTWCAKVNVCGPLGPPVAGADVASTPFNTPFSGSVASNDTAGNGGALSFAIATQPANGTVVMSSNGNYTFTPTTGFTGTTSFTYTLTEAGNGSTTGTVSVSVAVQPPGPVNAVNDGPIYAAGHLTSPFYNAPAPIKVVSPLTNDTGTGIVITAASVPVSAGTVTFTGSTISYTPANGATGQTTITYTITGTGGNTDTALINVLIGTPQFNSFGNIVLGYQYSDGTITDQNNNP
jgi:hypothetical protein